MFTYLQLALSNLGAHVITNYDYCQHDEINGQRVVFASTKNCEGGRLSLREVSRVSVPLSVYRIMTLNLILSYCAF